MLTLGRSDKNDQVIKSRFASENKSLLDNS